MYFLRLRASGKREPDLDPELHRFADRFDATKPS
jgi:hypothetical protein